MKHMHTRASTRLASGYPVPLTVAFARAGRAELDVRALEEKEPAEVGDGG